MDPEKEKKMVISVLKSIIVSVKGGLPFYQLDADYLEQNGQKIPYKKFGFSSLDAFVRSIPEVKVSTVGGDTVLTVADPKMDHITSLLNRQKPAKKKGRPNKRKVFGGRMTYGKPSARQGGRPSFSNAPRVFTSRAAAYATYATATYASYAPPSYATYAPTTHASTTYAPTTYARPSGRNAKSSTSSTVSNSNPSTSKAAAAKSTSKAAAAKSTSSVPAPAVKTNIYKGVERNRNLGSGDCPLTEFNNNLSSLRKVKDNQPNSRVKEDNTKSYAVIQGDGFVQYIPTCQLRKTDTAPSSKIESKTSKENRNISNTPSVSDEEDLVPNNSNDINVTNKSRVPPVAFNCKAVKSSELASDVQKGVAGVSQEIQQRLMEAIGRGRGAFRRPQQVPGAIADTPTRRPPHPRIVYDLSPPSSSDSRVSSVAERVSVLGLRQHPQVQVHQRGEYVVPSYRAVSIIPQKATDGDGVDGNTLQVTIANKVPMTNNTSADTYNEWSDCEDDEEDDEETFIEYEKQIQHPRFCNHQLIGDDFLLHFANYINEALVTVGGVRQCGFCISGLTLEECRYKIAKKRILADKVLLLVGTIDILQGRELSHLKLHLLSMLNDIKDKTKSVTLCTIPPLYRLNENRKYVRQVYNRFIRTMQTETTHLLDLDVPFLDDDRNIAAEYFEPVRSEIVLNIDAPPVLLNLWNEEGLQRVRSLFQKGLVR